MDLSRFPRRRYTDRWTPLHGLPRLSYELGGPNLFVKRDDLLGGAGGGNKTRKLEFAVAEALEQGADTLITCGAVQSNHCRLTASAAAQEGLACRLILEERVPGTYNPQNCGNNLLFHLLGVGNIRVVPGGSDLTAEMKAEAEEVASAGGKAYVIPGGASYPIGALGYAACAQELLTQSFELGLRVDRVVCASGSAGTHAGLVTGFHALNSVVGVVGINVSRTKDEQEPIVHDLAARTAQLLGLRDEVPRDDVLCFGDYVGPGYSLPTAEMVAAVEVTARMEAILLDPVYTGKAMAGLFDLVRQSYFDPDENVVFLHTGGSPALHFYSDYFLS
jgi:D-cysteine desulfhydrase